MVSEAGASSGHFQQGRMETRNIHYLTQAQCSADTDLSSHCVNPKSLQDTINPLSIKTSLHMSK